MTDRLYTRISLDTAVSGSLDKQESRLSRHAAPGYVLYVERSVSGSKIPFADRPEGARLLAELERGDRVMVTKIDRAARNVRDLLNLVERIEEMGASIVFVDQNIDTAGPMGRFLLTLLGAVAELEANIIAERRRESLEAFRAEGRHAVGRAPYGLQSVQNPTGRGLVLRPHPEQAPILRDVVERLLAGMPQRDGAEIIGVSAPAFSRLLRNERLAGVISHDPDGTPRLDPDMAVFSLAEWQTLQDYVSRPDKAWTKADGYGAAFACGVCGDRLYFNRQTRRGRPYGVYACRKVLPIHKEGGKLAASIVRENADAYVEADFLARFGGISVVDEITLSTDHAKAEAVAAARMHLDAAKALQDAATTDEEDDAAAEAVKVAKRALRAAEAMPSETVTEVRDLGITFGELWDEAPDDDARTSLLLKAGRWIVAPGRLPIAEKVTFQPAGSAGEAPEGTK